MQEHALNKGRLMRHVIIREEFHVYGSNAFGALGPRYYACGRQPTLDCVEAEWTWRGGCVNPIRHETMEANLSLLLLGSYLHDMVQPMAARCQCLMSPRLALKEISHLDEAVTKMCTMFSSSTEQQPELRLRHCWRNAT